MARLNSCASNLKRVGGLLKTVILLFTGLHKETKPGVNGVLVKIHIIYFLISSQMC
jgi:hypothetical protein